MCGATDTPQWRCNPQGDGYVCNRYVQLTYVYLGFGCGSEFLKLAPFLEYSPPKLIFTQRV